MILSRKTDFGYSLKNSLLIQISKSAIQMMLTAQTVSLVSAAIQQKLST
jgi:hypothetical protein